MIASVPGSISAAPTPCTTRAAISTPIEGATAHASDPRPKIDSPISTTRLWPRRSPIVPPARSSAASASA